ncbi:MAG: hypothetical protein ACI9KE_006193, partial [Polyangiales bacterium]
MKTMKTMKMLQTIGWLSILGLATGCGSATPGA